MSSINASKAVFGYCGSCGLRGKWERNYLDGGKRPYTAVLLGRSEAHNLWIGEFDPHYRYQGVPAQTVAYS